MPREPLNSYINDILTNIKAPSGERLFVRVDGSQGNNLNLPSSDFNVVGVWAVPESTLLDASPLKKQVRIPRGVLYEVSYFCHLLLQGVPTAIRILYGDHLCIASPLWEELIAYRHRFLTQKIVDYHIFIADTTLNQLSKMHGRDVAISNKNLYRLLKLMFTIHSMSSGREPMIWFTDKTIVDCLMQARQGDLKEEYVLEMCAAGLLDARKKAPYALPSTPDYDFLEDWLIRTRKIM